MPKFLAFDAAARPRHKGMFVSTTGKVTGRKFSKPQDVALKVPVAPTAAADKKFTAFDAEWNESAHKRGEGGQFGSGADHAKAYATKHGIDHDTIREQKGSATVHHHGTVPDLHKSLTNEGFVKKDSVQMDRQVAHGYDHPTQGHSATIYERPTAGYTSANVTFIDPKYRAKAVAAQQPRGAAPKAAPALPKGTSRLTKSLLR